ncbi:MAG: hypothetical protein ACKV1O_28095 [Saprospiraceae bacterium]
MRTFLPVLILCAVIQSGFGQEKVIEFINPSFEDVAKIASPPINWYDCGFPGTSPPDVLPEPTFNAMQPAYDGKTYLGMVVRDNNTWEAVSQKLGQPLQVGQCYQLEVYLARSENYMSISRITENTTNYTTPTIFRVFGAFNDCKGRQFLAQTPAISHTKWKPYVLRFEPASEAFDHLIFEVYFDESQSFPYNGNIMVDHLSNLTPVDCGTLPKQKNEPTPKYTSRPTPVTPPKDAKTDSLLLNRTPIARNKIDIPMSYPPVVSGKKTRKKPPRKRPTPVAELHGIVRIYSSQIIFDSTGNLERSYSLDYYPDKARLINPPLHRILESLHLHPLSKLIIIVIEKDATLAGIKKQNLMQAINEIGVAQDQVTIRDWQEKDAKMTWYGDEDFGVLMRLL